VAKRRWSLPPAGRPRPGPPRRQPRFGWRAGLTRRRWKS